MPRAKRRISKKVSRKRKRSVGRRRPMRRTRLQIEDDGGLAIYQEANRIINTPYDLFGDFQNNLYGIPIEQLTQNTKQEEANVKRAVVNANRLEKEADGLRKKISTIESNLKKERIGRNKSYGELKKEFKS